MSVLGDLISDLEQKAAELERRKGAVLAEYDKAIGLLRANIATLRGSPAAPAEYRTKAQQAEQRRQIVLDLLKAGGAAGVAREDLLTGLRTQMPDSTVQHLGAALRVLKEDIPGVVDDGDRCYYMTSEEEEEEIP